ncbi:hypothetical protein PFISCL1PPCAC_4474, partial [Pristionchus fissidentatus]
VLLCLLSIAVSQTDAATCNPLLVPCRTSDALSTQFIIDELPNTLSPPNSPKERAVLEALLQIDLFFTSTQVDLLKHSNAVDQLRVAYKLYSTQNEWDDEAKMRFFVALVAEEAIDKLPPNTSRDIRGTILESICPLRENEECASTKYRSLDGVCNNVRHTDWGAAYSRLQRYLPSIYPHTIAGQPTHPHLPSSRLVSSRLFKQQGNPPEIRLTQLVAHFAHYVYADLVQLSKPRIDTDSGSHALPCCDPAMKHPECTSIDVAANDTRFLGFIRCMPYARTSSAPNRGCDMGERQQANLATSFLDASLLYGNEDRLAMRLRAKSHGLLLTTYSSSADFSLPMDGPKSHCADGARSCFLGGSNQINFLPTTAALHTIWLRQHNRIVKELEEMNSHWSDTKLYQEARRIVVAQLQHVTYNEWLPVLMSREIWAEYKLKGERSGYTSGYSTSVDPSVLNSYAAVVGQFFFTMFGNRLQHFDALDRPVLDRPLSEIFNDPASLFLSDNIAGLIR